MPEEIWTDVHDVVQEAVIKTILKKKKCKKAKWLPEETLQTAVKRSRRQQTKRKIYPCECSVQDHPQEKEMQKGKMVV